MLKNNSYRPIGHRLCYVVKRYSVKVVMHEGTVSAIYRPKHCTCVNINFK